MTEDELTRPERSAQLKQARRYREAIEKAGMCCACLHRDRYSAPFGINHCRLKVERRYPTCTKDKRGPEFELDTTALQQFNKAA